MEEEITWKEIEYKILNGQTHLLTNKILKNFPFENTGNEFKIPPWQYRLQNFTVSFIHSVMSATCALCFASFHTEAMFEQPMHWYKHWAIYGLLFSLGYFFHDMQDVLRFENSLITIQFTLLHHLSSSFAFVTAITSRKFVPFAYCALIMETNSIFLHIRALMQLSNNSSKHYIFYKFIQLINVITFVGCRFGIQAWQIYWVYKHHNAMHTFFAAFGYIGGIVFYIINGILFLRLLAADGMLGDFGRKHVHKFREDVNNEKKE
uniref:TLC domain-containing protein n=1 Tax=Panagrolaimus superbus TaxID=310955 RepID=A0A914Y3W0_9BILA